jgi:hypothetical protein
MLVFATVWQNLERALLWLLHSSRITLRFMCQLDAHIKPLRFILHSCLFEWIAKMSGMSLLSVEAWLLWYFESLAHSTLLRADKFAKLTEWYTVLQKQKGQHAGPSRRKWWRHTDRLVCGHQEEMEGGKFQNICALAGCCKRVSHGRLDGLHLCVSRKHV